MSVPFWHIYALLGSLTRRRGQPKIETPLLNSVECPVFLLLMFNHRRQQQQPSISRKERSLVFDQSGTSIPELSDSHRLPASWCGVELPRSHSIDCFGSANFKISPAQLGPSGLSTSRIRNVMSGPRTDSRRTDFVEQKARGVLRAVERARLQFLQKTRSPRCVHTCPMISHGKQPWPSKISPDQIKFSH